MVFTLLTAVWRSMSGPYVGLSCLPRTAFNHTYIDICYSVLHCVFQQFLTLPICTELLSAKVLSCRIHHCLHWSVWSILNYGYMTFTLNTVACGTWVWPFLSAHILWSLAFIVRTHCLESGLYCQLTHSWVWPLLSADILVNLVFIVSWHTRVSLVFIICSHTLESGIYCQLTHSVHELSTFCIQYKWCIIFPYCCLGWLNLALTFSWYIVVLRMCLLCSIYLCLTPWLLHII